MASSEPDWHPEAIRDAEEAKRWFAERSPLAAHGFLLALDRAVEAVIEAPDRWPLHRHGCRRYVFPNQYPYSLVYRLHGRSHVEVVAVAHHKRRRGYWRRR